VCVLGFVFVSEAASVAVWFGFYVVFNMVIGVL